MGKNMEGAVVFAFGGIAFFAAGLNAGLIEYNLYGWGIVVVGVLLFLLGLYELIS